MSADQRTGTHYNFHARKKKEPEDLENHFPGWHGDKCMVSYTGSIEMSGC